MSPVFEDLIGKTCILNGTGWGHSNYSPIVSSMIAGAKGLNGSRSSILVLAVTAYLDAEGRQGSSELRARAASLHSTLQPTDDRAVRDCGCCILAKPLLIILFPDNTAFSL